MSYILDALRKSEQQRQAVQPDNVTDRILINPPQHSQKPVKWIAALVIGNLLIIAYLAWFFTHMTPDEPKPNANGNTGQQLPLAPGSKDQTAQKLDQPPSLQIAPKPLAPSISELVEAQKIAERQAPTKPTPDKKPQAAKKEPTTHKLAAVTSKPEMLEPETRAPEIASPKKGILTVDELPYEFRNNLPKLSINVFNYAQQPEDRFVIIDMAKYRTGQLIKGSVKLREIRPDSIVLESGEYTFRVERP